MWFAFEILFVVFVFWKYKLSLYIQNNCKDDDVDEDEYHGMLSVSKRL